MNMTSFILITITLITATYTLRPIWGLRKSNLIIILKIESLLDHINLNANGIVASNLDEEGADIQENPTIKRTSEFEEIKDDYHMAT